MWRIVAVAALVVVGCSSGSEPSAEPTEEALKESVVAFDAALRGDVAETYDFLSDRCREEWKRGDWAGNVTGGLMMAQAFGMDFADATLDEVEVSDFVEGESATVLTKFVDKDGEPWSDDPGEGGPWVFEDGWRMDECDAIGE